MKLEGSVVGEEKSWEPRLEEPALHGWVDKEESIKEPKKDKAEKNMRRFFSFVIVNYKRTGTSLTKEWMFKGEAHPRTLSPVSGSIQACHNIA